MDYLFSIIWMLVIPMFLGLLLGLGWCCFCCCRGCCDTCGTKQLNPNGYSACNRHTTYGLFVLFGVVCIAGALVGALGILNVPVALNGAFQVLVDGIANIVSKIETAITDLNALNTKYGYGQVNADDVVSSLNSISATATDFREQTLSNTVIVQAISAAIFFMALLQVLVGIIGGLFKCRGVGMTTAVCMMLGAVIFWICFGVGLAFATIVDDVCLTIPNFDPAASTGGEEGGGLALFANCEAGSGDSLLSDAVSGAADGLDTYNLGASGALAAPVPYIRSTVVENAATLLAALETSYANKGSDTFLLSAGYEQAKGYLSVIVNIKGFSDCTDIATVLNDFSTELCSTTLSALDLFWFGSMLLAVFGFPAIWLAVLGNKRWQKAAIPTTVKSAGPVSAQVQPTDQPASLEQGPQVTPGQPPAEVAGAPFAGAAMAAALAEQPAEPYEQQENVAGQAPLPPIGGAPQQQQDAGPLSNNTNTSSLPPIAGAMPMHPPAYSPGPLQQSQDIAGSSMNPPDSLDNANAAAEDAAPLPEKSTLPAISSGPSSSALPPISGAGAGTSSTLPPIGGGSAVSNPAPVTPGSSLPPIGGASSSALPEKDNAAPEKDDDTADNPPHKSLLKEE